MTLTLLMAHLVLFCTIEPLACCLYRDRFMWSFLLRPCCATFGLVRKINDKNDQESTICNVCDGEIHRRGWGWVDSLLPNCSLIKCGVENNSCIKTNWRMASSGGRGSWGYALWRCYCNYITWPWRRFRDVMMLIYNSWLISIGKGVVDFRCQAWELFCHRHPVLNCVHRCTQSHWWSA